MKVKTLAVAAWVAALGTWAIYERTLERHAPPPPPPPPPPAACRHEGDLSALVSRRLREGHRLLWTYGVRSTYPAPHIDPDVYAIAYDGALTFARVDRRCPACGAEILCQTDSFEYRDMIAQGPELTDINGDGRTDLLVPVWHDRWDVYEVGPDAVRPLTPPLDGAFPGRPADVDGDGVCELIYWTGGFARFMVWDGAAYREELARPLYEREMFDLAGFPEDYLFYAALLGRFDDAFEVARPWILAAGEDEHALRERLERTFDPR